MEKYINFTGDSKITHYEIGDEYILIKSNKRVIEYNSSNNSKDHIERMKVLAQKGSGLYRYIMKNKLKKENQMLHRN